VPVEAMGQVAINVNGRLYRFDCGDGEEKRLQELAAYVKGRIESLVKEYGKVGDERLMLTAALLITDELLDARAELAELTKAGAAQALPIESAQSQPQQSDPDSSEPLEHDSEPEPEEIPRKVAGGEA
jgi:cell division protein ZapA